MAAIKKIKLPRVTTPYDILDANAVHKTGDEEINGKKTFNNSPLVPTPTVDRGATPKSYVDSLIAGVADAMLFKGTLGQAKDGATVTALPANHKVGWTYKVVTAGTYAGMACEVGDMIACIKTRTTANNADWTVFQGNIDGAVTGYSFAVLDTLCLAVYLIFDSSLYSLCGVEVLDLRSCSELV